MAFFTPRRGYRGPERRRHRVFVTRNSEYHCRDNICVAVRSLRSGEFYEDHPAIGRRMIGGIGVSADGILESFSRKGESPSPGESLFFSDDSVRYPLRTSPLCAIQRPARAIVERYRAEPAADLAPDAGGRCSNCAARYGSGLAR